VRCAALIAAWSGGRVLRGVAGAGAIPERRWVSIRPSRASALLGYEVTPADAAAVFATLRMAARADAEDRLEVEIPGYRVDIEREVDLIEEVARIQGYDRIESTLPTVHQAGGMPPAYAFVRRLRDVLVRAGLHEARLLSFASQEDLDLMGDTDAIGLTNPLQADEAALRTSLAPGLLHAAAQDLSLDLARSVVVGDRWDDVGAARAIGGRAVLVRTGYGRAAESAPRPNLAADTVKDNLAAAVAWILQQP